MIKKITILFCSFWASIALHAQDTIEARPPIPDSIKQVIIEGITERNLDFLARKNPKYSRKELYDSDGFTERYGRAILGIEDRAPGDNHTFYAFSFDIRRTAWPDIYLAEKKSNCLHADIYTDFKKKNLYKRDTVCFDLDSAIFPFDKRFLVYYDPNAEGYKYLALAGNLEIWGDLIEYKKLTHEGNCRTNAEMRLMQFGNTAFFGTLPTPAGANYYQFRCFNEVFSTSPIIVRFPKEPQYNWIDIEFYTNNRKYSKDTGYYYRGGIYKVLYHLRDDAKDIREWYPTVTRVTDWLNDVERKYGEEFIERLRYPIKIEERYE